VSRSTSDATGPGLTYYNSGYLPPADFWRLETIFGLIFLTAVLAVVTMSSRAQSARQRIPVILSHSRTYWVCVFRKLSQSVGANTLNSVIGMPPDGGGTSLRGE
jgi:di/tricarboxylate transporter